MQVDMADESTIFIWSNGHPYSSKKEYGQMISLNEQEFGKPFTNVFINTCIPLAACFSKFVGARNVIVDRECSENNADVGKTAEADHRIRLCLSQQTERLEDVFKSCPKTSRQIGKLFWKADARQGNKRQLGIGAAECLVDALFGNQQLINIMRLTPTQIQMVM